VRDTLLGRPGGAGRAGAIVTGVALAAGGYALGTLRARRGHSPSFSWGPITPEGAPGEDRDAGTKEAVA
ncbi:glycosyltransferase family 2 protein, partial [Streptomyces sp. NPDC056049]